MNPYQRDNSAPQGGGQQYKDFSATQLFCPRCRQASPVRERLLLVLPDGDLYEYLCVYCGMALGEKRVKERVPIEIVS
ncbi:cytoplasmic protein [candidate division KSB3 bacterium]|uniref:Cytoplasmic protein n=1 Tax=candidate division KSB3 bacterium TaxID=2044937 RepID=A0A2G6E2V2_9BACT|nr:MAG: cytoplasmic protein [candidate division KSB3 bacterium]PIE29306.1 MAG: cytoplasmic protein [candidate division KSB3 bacterium]